MSASLTWRVALGLLAAAGGFGVAVVAWSEGDVPAAPAGPAAPPAYVSAPADVLIAVTGRQNGLMKPCGCSEPQRGGLLRLAALLDAARATAKASAAVSLGETLTDASMPEQNQLKAELFRASLGAMDFRGMLLSGADLSPFYPALAQPYGTPAETPRPPLNVRIKPTGIAAASASVDPILQFEVGGVRVRAVSVVDPTLREDLVGMGIADAVVAPEAALEALTKEPGVLLVAAHVLRESMALVVKAAQLASDTVIVVDMGGGVAYDRPVSGYGFAKPMLVTFEGHGKAVGLLRLTKSTAKGGPPWTASYESVLLDPPFDGSPSKTRPAVQAIFDAYRQRVRDEKLIEKFGRFEDGGTKFVGSEACAKCHEAIYEDWKLTPHTHAFETLVDKGVERDPECVTCHTVGWSRDREKWSRNQSSFFTAEASPKLLGVGCESCHGAGSEHVAWPDKKELFGAWKAEGKMWKDFGRQGCEKCHDIENSVNFGKAGAYEKDFRPVVDHRDVPKQQRTVVPK